MTKYISDEELTELEQLAKAASPRPWSALDYLYTVDDARGFVVCDTDREPDAAFLVAACNSIEPLVAEVRRLRAALRDIVSAESHILRACDGCGGVCHVEHAKDALSPPKDPR